MIDQNIFYFFNSLAGHWRIFDGFVIFFSSYFQYILVALFLLLCAGYSKRKKYFFFLTALSSVLFARLIVVPLMQYLFNRPRPFLSLSGVKQLVSPIGSSFPSGHAAFFFALAAVIFIFNKKWGVWFFLAAIIISISRVIAGVHYPLDIAAGALVGIISAYIVVFAGRLVYNASEDK